MFRAALIFALLLPACTVEAGNDHGKREYRETGYYQWDAYKCKWIWYPFAKQAYGSYDNHSTTLHLTVNNFQSSAKRGENQYATVDVGYRATPLDPNATLNFAKELLSVAYRGANDGFNQAMSYASQQGANDIAIVQELVQVKKLEASALILESSKPQASTGPSHCPHPHRQPSTPEATPRPAPPATGGLPAIEAKCQGCHGDGQGGGGVVFGPLSGLTPVRLSLAMDYVTKIDDTNCSRRAKLSPEEHKELVDYLCQLKAKSNQ